MKRRKGDMQEEDLQRCLIGYCGKTIRKKTTLVDIRKWVSANWKKVFGVNIYELKYEIFMFEFLDKHMAETIQG